MAREDLAVAGGKLKVLSLFMLILVLVCAGVMYAQPVEDGDLWFHLAYAKFMIQNHTLIPDHTIYSWTPASGLEIYCAWIPELILYALYEKGGLPLLFALRYLCLAVFILLVILFAKRAGILWHPLTWLICLTGVLMSCAGLLIKPEMLSYVFMSLMVFLWLSIKSHPRRAWLCYLIPVLLLIWINSHGAVIFGMVFIGTLLLGELANMLLSRDEALPPDIRRHFFIAVLLCLPVVLLTPYGWEYPAQLIQEYVVHKQNKLNDYMDIRAYQSIFTPRTSQHYVQYLIIATAVLAGLLWPKVRSRKTDWTLILMNLAFGLLYMKFVRTTYFWAIVVTFTSLSLLAGKETWAWYRKYTLQRYFLAVVLAVFFFLSGRSLYESACKPLFGFWINYVSPIEEAEFIRSNLSGLRMGNDYNSGAYLLWALWPQQKVFIDARYFPYKAWYGDYSQFLDGKNVIPFLKKYPCDFWFLSYSFPGLEYFRKCPDWRLAHYGPSGCIFTRKGIELPESPGRAAAFDTKLTLYQASEVLKFALAIDDLETARKIAGSVIEDSYLCPPKKALSFEARIRLGSALERHGLIDESIEQYSKALEVDRKKPEVYVKLGNLYTRKHDPDKAIDHYTAALSIQPDSLEAMNNLSIIYAMNGRPDRSLEYLQKMMALKPEDSGIYYNISCIYAKQGRVGESVAWLKKAVEKGFNDWSLLRSDPDLMGIRETPYFKAILETR